MSDEGGHAPASDHATGSLGDQPAFLGFEPAPPVAAEPYRVLARKYRPETFADLIGQDAMVRTISNAFSSGRIPQAWMLTGVRGVGKTTTARILARALNYDRGEGAAGPSVDMPALGLHCRSIIESRHVDVMEMDAASHTGIDDVRQITDGVRYAPVQARYKVYIIDEVHMLSEKAFNAFLKTLEEPPPHAKFVFATTEIRKVPVTVLSRCQRFDLRRVDTATLSAHLERICAREAVSAEPEALLTIARAAEGSVRDSLSLLDQAVAHGAGSVTGEAVRDMLGLADRGQVVDLFEAVMRGDVPAAFALLRAGWELGADPGQTLSDLAAFTHTVTRLKLVPDAAKDPALTEAERVRGRAFAERLSVRSLSRAWQILLKALPEVNGSGRPLAAAEMVLVRLAYAADLPTPDEVLRTLRRDGPPAPASAPVAPAPARGGSGSSAARAMVEPARAWPNRQAQPDRRTEPDRQVEPQHLVLRSFADVVALAGERREIGLKGALERDVRVVRFEEGRIEIGLTAGAARTLPNDLSRALSTWTGRRWVVSLATDASEPTLDEGRRRREGERRTGASAHPLVQAVLSAFPGAEVVDVRDRAMPEPEAPPAAGPSEDEDEDGDEDEVAEDA